MSDDPPMYGQIPIPHGKPGCLNGINFVISGTLRSLKREQAKDLIESCGGKVTGSISGKTDVLLRGCVNVGPSKMSDASKRGLKIIDEESIFDFLEKSNPDWKPPPPPRIEGGVELPQSMFPTSSLLTEKYRPRYLREVIGNLGSINGLIDFLKGYVCDSLPKCAILSGPPGIGKSTTASLVSLYCGYQPLELNASDTRSKKSLQETFQEVFNNKSLKHDGTDKQICLIFDEVDGMSSGDRGGLQQLVKFIDTATNPVICICNDRDSKKLEALGKRGIDIKFSRAQVSEIVDRLKEIVKMENLTISDETIGEIATGCGGDFRQALNMLSFWSLGGSDPTAGEATKRSEKIVGIRDPVDACQILTRTKTSLEERFDCFFVDYGLVPLYLHENMPFTAGKDHDWADALESIADSDVISSYTYQSSDFSVLTPLGLMSTVIPSTLTAAKEFGSMAMFPQYWGKSSRQRKIERWLQELGRRMSRCCSVPTAEIFDSAAPLLHERFNSILGGRKPSISGALDLMDELEITLDDYERLEELTRYLSVPLSKAPKVGPKPAVKAEVTHAYKERHCNARDVVGHYADTRADYLISEMPRGMAPKKAKAPRQRPKRAPRIRGEWDEVLSDSYSEISDSETEENKAPTPKTTRKGKAASKKGAVAKRGRRKGRADGSDSEEDVPDSDDEKFVVDDESEDDVKPARGKSKGKRGKSKKEVVEEESESEPEADFSDDDDDGEIEGELEDSDEEAKNKKEKIRQTREEKKKKEIEKKIKKRSKKTKTSRRGL